ncbi:MAG: beta strand repeat-containing protein [Gemmatimonadales bacterium]
MLLIGCSNDSPTGPLASGSAAQLGITRQPSASAASGVAFGQQPAIQLLDASGRTVDEAGVIVTAAIAGGDGALGGTLTSMTNANGLATFFNLSIAGNAGARTLNFLAAGLAGATSDAIVISVGTAAALGIATNPSATAASGALLGQQPVIQLLDVNGDPVNQAGIAVTVSMASGSGTIGGTTTVMTDATGRAAFTDLTITGVIGPRSLNFMAPGSLGVTSGTIILAAGAPSQLTITSQPALNAASGAAFTPQPSVQLRDSAGNAVSQLGWTVTASIATGGGTLVGATSAVTNGNGLATFAGLSLVGTAGDRTLNFTATTLAGVTSNTVTITAGAAAQLVITTQPPALAASGVNLAPQPVLQLRDAAGNAVGQVGVVVTASIATGNGALGGTLTASTDINGVATFTSLSLTGVAGDRVLNFTAPNLVGTTSTPVTVTAGVVGQLAITTQPSAIAASGVIFAQQPVVQLRDAAGNAVNLAGVPVTALIATGSAAMTGTLTVMTNAGGAAVFTDLVIAGIVGARTLAFTSGGLTSAISSTVTITAGPPAGLMVVTQPAVLAASGVAFVPQPSVQVQDAAGNAVSLAGVTVTAAIGFGGGTLGGATNSVTAGNGLATFTGLFITGAVGARILTFTSNGLAGTLSNTVTVTAGAATQLFIATQPSATAPSGVAFAQQPVVQLLDAAGDPVSQAGVVVTAAIATGGGTAGGTLTAITNANGAATFFNLSVTGSAGDRTLNFTAPAVTGVTSAAVTITTAATQLTMTTQPSAAAASGAAFAQQPAVQLRDAGGIVVNQAGVSVTAAINSGGGVLGTTLTATTNASGVATFTDLSITGTVGSRTLAFSAAGVTSATSNAVAITAGAATQLTITTEPSITAASGSAFALQPVLQLRDAAGNAVSSAGVTVNVMIASGGGTLGGATAVVTSAAGVATFAGLSIRGTVGDRTLGFSASGLTGATSTTVTITPGAATHLTITTQPSANATSGVAFAQQPAIQLNDADGNAVAQIGTVITAAIASGGGTLGGTLTATTNASGLATFTNLAITGTTGSRTLNFTAPALAGVTSTAIALP